ncbi:unnamed protein product, partial [marine sediment metagenome]
SAEGPYWDFLGLTHVLYFPASDNTTILEYGQNYTYNWTSIDQNLKYLFFNTTNATGYQFATDEIDVGGNTTFNWELEFTANYGLGEFIYEISSSDEHNPLKSNEARDNVKKLDLYIGGKKISKLDGIRNEKENKLEFRKEGKTILEVKFMDVEKDGGIIDADFIDNTYKLGFCVKTDEDAQIRIGLIADKLQPIARSPYAGHFLYGDRYEYSFDFSDVISENIQVAVADTIVTLSKATWKKNTVECLDPVAKGVNIKTETYLFTILDTTPPAWNTTPTD